MASSLLFSASSSHSFFHFHPLPHSSATLSSSFSLSTSHSSLFKPRYLKAWILLRKDLKCILEALARVGCTIWFMKFWIMLLTKLKLNLLPRLMLFYNRMVL
ncbi:uncharacterized protein LOC107637519 [Arachis ipaensis]|uniref:uncharacterized protein LOC107637519 n=1 Tax=Arachis ipaensis TaxID=130454 RepID=UPI0007AF1B65|nr:uncharacterized protein LOC107637519 [Arachis ipaensis]